MRIMILASLQCLKNNLWSELIQVFSSFFILGKPIIPITALDHIMTSPIGRPPHHILLQIPTASSCTPLQALPLEKYSLHLFGSKTSQRMLLGKL